MSRTFRVIGLFAGGLVVLSGSVLVVNQTAQVVQLAGSVHPTLGSAALWGLLAAYAGLVGVPLVLFLRLPSPLIPPETEDGPEFERHLDRLRGRLGQSPHLAGHDFSGRGGIEGALTVLDARADEIVKEAASAVFVATAVSQSGRLDALLVLAAQSRMIWRVAHLYHQRPSARDLGHLYVNVAATTFLAGGLEDADLGEQVEPILSSAVGALGASLPGFQVAGSLLVNCVLSGSANAFLTLRVGMIARRHCGALVALPKSALRRSASADAAQMLGAIVASGTARISRAIWRVSVDKVGGAVSGVGAKARDAGARLLARVRPQKAQGPAEAV